jgi:hypothetical protein
MRYRADLEAAITREIAAKQRRHSHRLRSPRWIVASVSTIAVLALAITLVVTGGGDNSLIARAYAAISGDSAVIHFVATARRTPDPGDVTATAEIWTSGTRSRAIITVRRPGPLGHEVVHKHVIAADGNHVTMLKNGRITESTTAEQCALVLGFCNSTTGNPLASVSRLYHAGRLHTAGSETVNGRRLDLIIGTTAGADQPQISVRLLVDPSTATPVEIVEIFATGGRLTAEITGYRRMQPTPQTRRLLTLHLGRVRNKG